MDDFFRWLLNDPTFKITSQSMPAIPVALFGGLIALFYRTSQRLSVRLFVGGLLGAAFAGFLTDLLVRYLGGGDLLRVLSVSLSGFCARDVLDMFRRKFLKALDKVDSDDR